MRAGHQPRQIQDQRRRKRRVTPLPDRLQHHPRTQEPVERDVVPRRLPVTERRNVVDVDLTLGHRSQGVGERTGLARVLGGSGLGVGQHRAVTSAEQIRTGPCLHDQGTLHEHRPEHGSQQRLTRLAVTARIRHSIGGGRRCERLVAQARRGGEVHIGAVGPQRRGRVERTGREPCVARARGRFGGGDVDHHDPGERVAGGEVGDVGGELRDEFPVAAHVPGERSTGAYLGVGGGQFALYRGRQAVRQHSPSGEFLGPFRQRRVVDVVAAEDERGE